MRGKMLRVWMREARARRRTRDVMNDVTPDVARLRTRDNPLRMKRAHERRRRNSVSPPRRAFRCGRAEKSPDDVRRMVPRATLVAAFVAFASGSCLEPAVELFGSWL